MLEKKDGDEEEPTAESQIMEYEALERRMQSDSAIGYGMASAMIAASILSLVTALDIYEGHGYDSTIFSLYPDLDT